MMKRTFGFFAATVKGVRASKTLNNFFIETVLQVGRLFLEERNEVIEHSLQGSPDFAFVVRGGDHHQVELGKDGHVLSPRTDTADEVHLVVGRPFLPVVKIVKIAFSFVGVHDLTNVFGGEQLFTVVFAS
jgi:hypothetical protein